MLHETLGKSRPQIPRGCGRSRRSYPFSFAIKRSAASTSMRTRPGTFLAGHVDRRVGGISTDSRVEGRVKMSGIHRPRSDWTDKAFRIPALLRTPAKGFSSPGRCGAGERTHPTSRPGNRPAGVLVRIPPALRSYTDGQDEVVLEASDVRRDAARPRCELPGIRDRVVDEAGRRRAVRERFVNGGIDRSVAAGIETESGRRSSTSPQRRRWLTWLVSIKKKGSVSVATGRRKADPLPFSDRKKWSVAGPFMEAGPSIT